MLLESYERSQEWRDLAKATKVLYAHYLRELLPSKVMAVRDVSHRQLLEMRDAISSTRGNGAGTGFTRAVQALFKWAKGRRWVDVSPAVDMGSLPGGHLPAWHSAHVELALAHLREPLRRAVYLAAATAQRRGDLIALRWTDYDGTVLRFAQQKTGRKMVLHLGPDVCAELNRWRAENTALTILTNDVDEPWTAQNITDCLRRALAKIPGIPEGFGIHGLRKFRAADLAEQGATVHQIAAVTGHLTLSMVELYTKDADQERLSKQASKRLSAVVRLSRKPKQSEGVR